MGNHADMSKTDSGYVDQLVQLVCVLQHLSLQKDGETNSAITTTAMSSHRSNMYGIAASIIFTLIILQNKASRAVTYNKTKTDTLYFTYILDLIKLSVANFMQLFDNCGLPEHFDQNFCKAASGHNYQTSLLFCKKYHFPRLKPSLSQFLWFILVLHFGLKFKSLSSFLFGKYYKNVLLSCQYASLFFIHVLVPNFYNFICSTSFCSTLHVS